MFHENSMHMDTAWRTHNNDRYRLTLVTILNGAGRLIPSRC